MDHSRWKWVLGAIPNSVVPSSNHWNCLLVFINITTKTQITKAEEKEEEKDEEKEEEKWEDKGEENGEEKAEWKEKAGEE